MASVSVEGVTGHHIPLVWPKLLPMVEDAMEKSLVSDYYGVGDVFKQITLQNMQLWICVVKKEVKAFAVTQIIKHPKRQVIDIFLVGGTDMKEWVINLWETLKAYGREKGCDEIRAFGRKGWVKVLPDKTQYSGSWRAEL